MDSVYDRLGNILRDRLDSDEDPFRTWESHTGKVRQAGNARERTPPPRKAPARELVPVPPGLENDFRILGLPPGTCLPECKAAWKRLLKANHPDYQSEENIERSTARTAKITEAYRRISRWFDTGSPD